ncbi:MAG: hypothetical protein ACJATP_003870 [Candidatus Azotimanducaceae bacterium]|jgi:hypothetical protein
MVDYEEGLEEEGGEGHHEGHHESHYKNEEHKRQPDLSVVDG